MRSGERRRVADIAAQRLSSQQLEQARFKTPVEVVAWLGAVQAQEYAGAKWALGLRIPGIKDQAVEQAFAEGQILRTHMLRPTWHFVTAADIRWIQNLTAPRVHAANAYYYRRLELNEAVFRQSTAALVAALQGGKQRTRRELAAALAEAGIIAEGQRLAYLVMRAELDGILCSGARRGKQFTYALLDERAPQARVLEREEALAELTRRYFTSHGPAKVADFAWWSGLTIADVKAGLELAQSHLLAEETGGQTYWLSAAAPAAVPVPAACFLPTYDEMIIGYTDRSAYFEGPAEIPDIQRQLAFDSLILLGGRIAGSWRRTVSRGTLVIETAPLRTFTAEENEALAAAARRYGEFFGLPVVVK
jgi:hypothetical protein